MEPPPPTPLDLCHCSCDAEIDLMDEKISRVYEGVDKCESVLSYLSVLALVSGNTVPPSAYHKSCKISIQDKVSKFAKIKPRKFKYLVLKAITVPYKSSASSILIELFFQIEFQNLTKMCQQTTLTYQISMADSDQVSVT